LVATHEYHRAVEFYESAIRELNKALNGAPQSLKGDQKAAATSTGNTGAVNDLVILSHDLSKLYIKLGTDVFTI
jgi:fatty acid/phospholipid biosynthesis enzyme